VTDKLTHESRQDMDDRYYQTLIQMMQSQAYRELAAAQMFGFGLQFVPSLKWLKFMTWHIREEMEHYEAVVKMYHRVTGESVEPIVHERLGKRPIAFAQSWLELAMAQFLYDRGGFWQLREYEECSFVPYRDAVIKILKEEAGHQDLGERIVVQLCRSTESQASPEDKQKHFNTWLRQGLLSFGRPDTAGAQYAIGVGLKKRDAGAVMADFIEDIKPAVKACGLVFPPLEEIGIEAPAGLDLSLEAVDASAAQGYEE